MTWLISGTDAEVAANKRTSIKREADDNSKQISPASNPLPSPSQLKHLLNNISTSAATSSQPAPKRVKLGNDLKSMLAEFGAQEVRKELTQQIEAAKKEAEDTK